MWPNNILVTAANGDLAEAVVGVLRDAFPTTNIYGCEAGDLWPAKFYFNNVKQVPRGDKPNYISEIKRIEKQLNIDLIIPCSDVELLRFSTAQSENECSFTLLMPQHELIKAFSDKYLGAKWLENNNIISPQTVLLTEASPSDLPLIVKPRFGSGSVGIYKVTSPELLEGLKVEYGDTYVAQEYLDADDHEYTCAIFQNRDVIRTLILHRRLDAGRTVAATIVTEPKIEKVLLKFIKLSNLDGLINIQLRLTNKGPMIFEINPRVSSTVKMRHMLGFRDLEWAIQCINNEKLPDYKIPTDGSVYRLSREIVKS